MPQALIHSNRNPLGQASRVVSVSREEAEMVVRVVESIIGFAKDFPLEFHMYCPTDRWDPVLKRVGEGVIGIENQLERGANPIMVDADVLFAVTDLEECVSGSRDKRLESAKLALIISAGGAIGEWLFGLKWLGIPAYLISLAIVLGKPLSERFKKDPAEPFKPDTLSGAKLGDHTDKTKVLERVIVAPRPAIQRHHWGVVRPGRTISQGAVCLKKGRFLVRCEGWVGDQITPSSGWKLVELGECDEGRNAIVVWEPANLNPRETHFGPIPPDSGFEDTYWIEYVGPLTDGVMRRAGPFG